jgi:hypothetical protein
MVLQAAPVELPKPPTAEEMAKAKKLIAEDEKLKDRGIIEVIEDPSVATALPEHVYVAVIVRQFPVARPVPEGLSGANVFAVDRDGKVSILKDARSSRSSSVPTCARPRTTSNSRTPPAPGPAWLRCSIKMVSIASSRWTMPPRSRRWTAPARRPPR